MTEAFYDRISCARQNELLSDERQLFSCNSPELCQEIAAAATKLYADGHKVLAFTIAKESAVSALTTEVLMGLADYAYWNFDLSMCGSADSALAWTLKRRDYYYAMLEGAALELQKRRVACDKVTREADWALENYYIVAASQMDKVDNALAALKDLSEGNISYRAASTLIAKMCQHAFLGVGGAESKDAAYDKVMANMDSEKFRNMVYTFYDRTKNAKAENERNFAVPCAAILLMWYEKQGDYVEAKNFLEDSHLGEDMKKHLDDNIATAGVCSQISNATLGASVFTSLCIGLYSFTIHAATGTSAEHGADFFAWHTVPAVVVGFVLFHAITDSDSTNTFGRAWQLTKVWWLFLFFVLPIFPIATSFLASIGFFFVSLYAYPRYRGWV